jgi:hypothetical protein
MTAKSKGQIHPRRIDGLSQRRVSSSQTVVAGVHGVHQGYHGIMGESSRVESARAKQK